MGPLAGIRVVEFAGIGPGPFCAMLLADMGAQVVRITRPREKTGGEQFDVLHRSRPAIAIDLKSPAGHALALQFIERADALIEGFRPGVMERLRLGPEACLARNPKLIYGRITGWGQTGPLSEAAGHDINYIALSGALHAMGRANANPSPPLNLVGDFGGGGMLMAFGILCGIIEAQRSGVGQVVDAAMVEGAALQMAMIYGWKAAGRWSNQRETNLLDGGAHFYDTYQCADDKWIAVGAIEPQFYIELCEKLAIEPRDLEQMNPALWPAHKARLQELFRTQTRAEWCAIFEGSDACFAPVLDLDEAPEHRHNAARGSFVTIDGVRQPAPAPRFSRTPAAQPKAAEKTNQRLEEVLDEWGISCTALPPSAAT